MGQPRYCYRHPDRETGLSCTDCGRPVCTDCATFAHVGIRCPEHSGRPQGVRKVSTGARRGLGEGAGAWVTKTLIGLNVAVFLLALAVGQPFSGVRGRVAEEGALFVGNEVIGLAAGEWWRLVSSGFIHAGLLHLGFNMLLLWWFGAPLEGMLGRGRFVLLYFASLLAGSAGALLFAPQTPTVGASGAVFGLLGAAFVLERRAGVERGPAFVLIVLNLVLSFVIPGISIGGHIGGLVGGVLAMLALAQAERLRGRLSLLAVAGVVAVALVSALVAVLQVMRYS